MCEGSEAKRCVHMLYTLPAHLTNPFVLASRTALLGVSLTITEWSQEEEDEFKAPTISKFDKESSAYYSSARIWDDGIIDPADTRDVLSLALTAAMQEVGETKHGVFRM